MKNSRPAKTAKRRLGMESLERRELLAGDVIISVSGGNVTITGDEGDNRFTMVQQANGLFDIEGLDDEVFSGPTTGLRVRNLTVNLGDGDDIFVLTGAPLETLENPASILGTTRINGGRGSDLVTVAVVGRAIGTFIMPALAIDLDMGNDTSGELQDDVVTVLNSSAGRVDVKTGAGNDEIVIGNTTAVTLNVDAGVVLNLNGSTDNDFVNMGLVTSLYSTINLGTGNFDAEGPIENILELNGSLFGSLNIYGGNARDHVSMAGTLAAMNLSIYTYGGNDSVVMNDMQIGLTPADYADLANEIADLLGVNLANLPFNLIGLLSSLPALPGALSVSTGEGDDLVSANDLFSTFAIYFYLDGGNDEVRSARVESTIAWYFGGLGTDGRLLTEIGALSFLDLQFENVLPQAPL